MSRESMLAVAESRTFACKIREGLSTRGMFIGDLLVYDFFSQAIIYPLCVCFDLGLVVLSMQAGNIHEIYDFNAPFLCCQLQSSTTSLLFLGIRKNIK